jgi:4-amino-4-deoxy-L-arabinose transferase
MHENQLRFWFIVQLTFYGFLVIALSIYPLIMSHYIISGHQYFILFLLLGLLFILILNKEIALKEKMAYAASIFTFFLVLFATHFFSLNQKYFSTSKPVADWIIAQGLQDRTLYVYDRLVPSIAFHLQKPVITISRYNKREIQFEDDLSFLQRYLDINDQDIFNSLIDKFQLPTLLLCRKKTAGSIDEELLSAFRNKEEIGLWYLYY